MSNYDFYSVPRICFGRGQFSRAVELAAPWGSSVLIVHNGDAEGARKLLAQFVAAGIRAEALGQTGEPTVADVDRALAIARKADVRAVIGLGGGSAIDLAKATAALLANGGAALDYMEVIGKGQKITRASVPWMAIPTIAGSGAEVTRNAVIGSKEHRYKASIRGEGLLARVALIDPELAVSAPSGVTASSGMDALCQCIEAYVSTGASPMTDPLALRGVELAGRFLKRAVEQGTDLDAREGMAQAALFGGITLTNAGLGAVHGFAAPLGANFPAPHGAICAILLPPVMRANVAALRASVGSGSADAKDTLARYAQVGRALARQSDLPDADAIDAAIGICQRLAGDLNILPLRDFGVGPGDIAPMTALARKASSMRFNPVVLPNAALEQVLREAMDSPAMQS